ncbi:MAG: hypothetical protein ACE5OZ_09655 [Candidatus Heimdallarchaeota archaeon]
MSNRRQRIQIRVTLQGKIAEEFDMIKEELGVMNDSEVVRHLIRKKIKDLQE